MGYDTYSGKKGRVMIGQDAPDWQADHAYGLNQLVQPTTANGLVYWCTTAGESGSSEPSWPTTEGATVTDGTVVWTAMNPIVGKLNQQDLSMSASEVDTSGFEDDWGTSQVADNKWSGSFSGFAAHGSVAQQFLESCWAETTLIQYIRFYLKYVANPNSADPAVYRKPDVANYPEAGIRISNLSIGTTRSGAGTFNVSFTGSGPVTRVVDDGS